MEFIRGIDVSHWQGAIDWHSVKKAGIQFAFIKATEGGFYFDDTFNFNWENARKEGLLCGSYDFFHASGDKNGRMQARFYLDHIHLELTDLPPVLDIETLSSNMLPWIKQWVEEVTARTGRKPIIYTGPSIITNNLTEFNKVPAWLKELVLWLANPPAKGTPCNGTQPSFVPAVWPNWKIWQYCWEGSVPGIKADVDLDYFNGTLAELSQLAGGNLPVGAGDSSPGESSTSTKTTQTTSTATNPVLDPNAPNPATYTVRPNDTLWGIAQRFHVSLDVLKALNPMDDFNLIQIGDVVNIPARE